MSECTDVVPVSQAEPVPLTKQEIAAVKASEDFHKDLDTARENVLQLIKVGMEGVEKLVGIAKADEKPGSFDCLAAYLKMMSELNRDLIDISSRKKNELDADAAPPPSEVHNTQNNMLFVGSPHELAKALGLENEGL